MDSDMKDMSLGDIIKKEKEQKAGYQGGQRNNGVRGKFRRYKNYNKFGGSEKTPNANTSV